ncbi:MAG: sodium:solute symporter family protein [Longimicrobiales bacterium]|nr:sodium:solute symporter family protein [Longimicrobiales bacterium]
MTLNLAVFMVYCTAFIGLGIWVGRKVDTSAAFFVANRRLGPALIFSTVLAANIGAGSTIGAAGLGYRDGLASWWWVGSAAIGTFFLAFWVGPKIWRIASDAGLYTLGDYLQVRYGSGVRASITSIIWISTPALLAAQLIAMAKILGFLIGTPYEVNVFMGAVIISLYFVGGGLLSTAWVNMIHLIVLMSGFIIIVPWSLASAGGWEVVATSLPAKSDYLNFWEGGQSGWILLAILAPNFIVSPGIIQKVYGALDERAVRIGLTATAVSLLIFAIVPTLLGMIAHTYNPALMDNEDALLLVLDSGLPAIIGALGLAAIFSAEISSADAILYMLATSLSKDLYQRHLNPQASDRELLSVARWAAFSGAILSVLLALVLPSIIGALTIFYSLIAVCVFVPVVGGLLSQHPSSLEALAAGVVGLTTFLSGQFLITTSNNILLQPHLLALIASGITFAGISIWRSRVSGNS